jgi:GxxExxY protein
MIRHSISPELEALAEKVVDAAFQVHKTLGPGLLESVYETCLCHELSARNIPYKHQVELPLVYNGVRIDSGLRLDVMVADKIILELKSVEKMIPLYEAQLLTYLKLTDLRLGFLINFNVPLLKEGIKRMIR